MVRLSLISSVTFMLIKSMTKSVFMIAMIVKHSVLYAQLFNFLSIRESLSLKNITSLGAFLNYCLLKSICRKMERRICVGVTIIRWKFKEITDNLEKQKAQICRRSFFYIVRCEGKLNTSTLASHEFICNNSEVL